MTDAYLPPHEESVERLEEERLQKRKETLQRCGFVLASCFISILMTPIFIGVFSLFFEINFNLNIDLNSGDEPIPLEKVQQAILMIGSLVLVANAIFAIGATKMWQLKESWLLRPTALYAIIPILSLPLLPLTSGFGIKAMVILIKEDPEKLLHD